MKIATFCSIFPIQQKVGQYATVAVERFNIRFEKILGLEPGRNCCWVSIEFLDLQIDEVSTVVKIFIHIKETVSVYA